MFFVYFRSVLYNRTKFYPGWGLRDLEYVAVLYGGPTYCVLLYGGCKPSPTEPTAALVHSDAAICIISCAVLLLLYRECMTIFSPKRYRRASRDPQWQQSSCIMIDPGRPYELLLYLWCLKQHCVRVCCCMLCMTSAFSPAARVDNYGSVSRNTTLLCGSS